MNARAIRLAAVAVVLLALAAGAGVTWWRHAHRVVSDVITRPDPDIPGHPHVLLPNLRDAVVVVPDRPHDPAEARAADRFERIHRLRRFTVSTNDRGLRGPPFEVPAPGPRILCLGDSVTFGWGVAWEDSYPAVLGRELGVEVLDAGVPAMKPPTIAAWAERHARELDADLVVFARRPDWGGGAPDPVGELVEAVRRVRRAVAPVPVVLVLPPVSTFDVKGSRAWRREHEQVRARLGEVPVLELTPIFRAAQEGRPGIVLRLEGDVQRVVEQPGGTVLVEVRGAGDRLAPEVVELFESRRDLAEPLFFDGGHPDREGYALFARAVAAWLRERGLVPGA